MLSTRNRIRPSENACVPFVLNGLVANMEFTKIKLKIQTHGRQAAAATPPSSPSYLYLAPLYRQATKRTNKQSASNQHNWSRGKFIFELVNRTVLRYYDQDRIRHSLLELEHSTSRHLWCRRFMRTVPRQPFINKIASNACLHLKNISN